tara:strand:+ start:25510 stop:25686 length:177 start_codon:yes stop_codon:yes gene_type:complete
MGPYQNIIIATQNIIHQGDTKIETNDSHESGSELGMLQGAVQGAVQGQELTGELNRQV